MTRILGIAGSLRRASFNAGLLRAAIDGAPDGVQITAGDIADVPLYDGDLEAAEGLPPSVQVLQEALAAADGLLLVSPEYNGSIPGVLKNALDWMSRGPGLGYFKGKPVAVIGASPGGFGTVLAQAHWTPVMRALGMQPWYEAKLMVSRAGGSFDADGNLTDDKVREQLQAFLAGFAASL
ncbi:NADPH-dependent FMN reductase [Ketogulonicigenium robustum]|uniref:NADPH-dependent FMN reductase n=1 Tax=Ketogulonicigenium robustum TaxID=92947 RepID=A0A1W6P111_9RHOB|nr:NADPH-dependent FMN reductase [Ketogulonicigenium robustum]ARO15198.1 NADPH-dependent FMN reductase [Ketogulonicigenium robustum]